MPSPSAELDHHAATTGCVGTDGGAHIDKVTLAVNPCGGFDNLAPLAHCTADDAVRAREGGAS